MYNACFLNQDYFSNEVMTTMDNNTQKRIHHHHLCGGLSKLKTSSEHTDTVLVVGDISFPCHKAILAAMSTYFAAMFSSGMKESHDSIVTLKGISPIHFEKILDFIYSGEIDLTYENVTEILQLSSMYQIQALQLICEKYMAADICTQNCILQWKMAMTCHCLVLEERCFWFITENFIELSKTDDFLELNTDELIKYINSDCLNVCREEDVFNAVTLWLDFNIERGVKHFYEVCRNLRFPLMDSDLINAIAQKSICIKSYKCHQDFIQKAAKENQNSPVPGISLNPIAFRSRKEHALVMVDGRRQEVCCFTVHLKKLFSLAKFPYFSNAKAACVHKGDLYVSGGSDQPMAMVRFITDHNRWEYCSDLMEARLFHAMVSVRDHIYILGGFSKNSMTSPETVEKFNPVTGEILTVGEIAFTSGKMSVAALGDTIYMFGGSKVHYDYLDDELLNQPTILHSFNSVTNEACIISHMPTITIGSQAITVEDSVYIFSPNGNILTLLEGQSPNIVHVLKSMHHRHFRVVYHQGCFYLLQLAAPKVQDEKFVLKWNPQTKEEYVVLWNRLPRTLLDSHWMKVAINKQHLCYECR